MSRRFPRIVAILCVAGTLAAQVAACGNDVPALGEPSAPKGKDGARPNIVLVMTDDQEVASLERMPRVERLLADKGVSFENAFASYPLCCPSRATFQTGQYAHNHGVLDNRPPRGGYPAFDPDETLPVWLKRAGYETAYVGKYMNDYKKHDEIPPGWDRWFGMVEPGSRYFKAHVNDEGKFRKYFKHNPRHYSTDLFTRRAVRFIEEREGDSPFLLSVGYVAPHVAKSFQEGGRCADKGPEPAPRHLGAFKDIEIPRGPSFNEDDVSDKPQAVQKKPKLEGPELEKKTHKYQCRLETLLAVDEGVEDLVEALREAGELSETYFFFTSDNGFIQGEHRIDGGKAVPYEGAIRIPMIVRGPDVARGETAAELVSNVDVVPTMMDLSGARPGLELDGQTFEASLRDPAIQDGRAVLIESRKEPEVFTGVRTSRYLYVERGTGESELYDLREDPNELESVARSQVYAGVRQSLSSTLDRLKDCAGKECATTPQLTLEVSRSGRKDPGRECLRNRATVSIEGADTEFVRSAQVGMASDLGVPGGAEPRQIKVPSSPHAEVVAIVELADGRTKRLTSEVGGCP